MRPRSTPLPSAAGPSRRSRLVLVPFGLVFLAAGLLFEGFLAREFLRTAATYGWDQTPCVMTASEVIPDPAQTWPNQDFLVRVSYRYTAGGAERNSTALDRTPRTAFSDYGEAQRLADRLTEGTQTVCYVNPANPDEAVLRRGSLWMGLLLLFPLIFVALGGGLVWAGVRPARAEAPGLEKTKPISERPRARGRWILALVFGLFLALGASMTWAFLLRPALKIAAARSWPVVPCQVLASGVRSHRGDKSTTYSVNILYAYEYEGRPFRANRYSFFTGSSSGYGGKAAVAARYPAGRRAECFVNPADPTEAVLNRDFTAAAWVGLVPLVFALVGAGGLAGMMRRKEADAPSTLRDAPGAMDGLRGASGGKLKTASSPWGKFLGILFFAMVWNAIVSVFVWQLIESGRRGRFEWGLGVFLIPFVLIGLFLVAFAAHAFLGLFNPRPRLVVTPPEATPGSPLDIQWRFSGRTGVLRRVTLRLKGREEATFRQGGKVRTEKREFASFDIADTTARAEMASGQARFQVPPGLMHSWKAPHHRIVWVLQVQGIIRHWPDVDEEFVITMRPAPAAAAPPAEVA